ncbi:hypothetical protein [Curtobacterium flaccumfaciens]|uniref:hypothetical protein n=1 Tax=Curtobacterium flaccumfaciens TaxID=2035 RepID=UPI0027DB7B36|nr:hypothetical protein [Curtobacterium flaccumfaciens]
MTEQQQPPGSEQELTPKADHGEESYRGSGKLTGKRAVITGGTVASARPWRSRSRARVLTS